FVWVNNTGSSIFVPEIQVSFTCDEDYTFEPEAQCYYDDVCEPGSHPYMYQCQLPEDMPTGICEYDVDLQMHCIEVEVTDENYPDGLPGFWHDNYVFSEVGSEPDDDWYQFSLAEEPAFVALETMPECIGYYDPGLYLYDVEVWPDPDLGKGYCVQHNIVELELTPEDAGVMCGGTVDYDAYGSFDDAQVFPMDNHPGLTWTTIPSDEGYHDILVEVRERTTTDIEASDLVAVFVENYVNTDEPATLYVWLTNECDYGFLPDFSMMIPEIDEAPVLTLYGDDVENIAPPGTSVYKLEVDVGEIEPSEEGYFFEFSVEPAEIYIMTLPEGDVDVADDTLYYRFFRDNEAFLSVGETFDERLAEQWESNNMWTWTVADEEWTSAGPHTVYVEVTDDLGNPDFTGEGDRIGIATLEVTVTDDGSEPDVGTGDDTEGSEDAGTTEGTEDTGDAGSTTGSETEEEEDEPEEETGGGGIGDVIQSFIDQILEILRGILG
ncbi:MAG: hypothetical protein NWF07_01415, partial [Candidatus Bathyarchaeota archaeon]|nr:hypothetical protein [Candidatus Bathyarchaeota archaeon]